MDEEDPIVQEIKLTEVDKFMVLLQYPLRNIDRPYGDQGELK